MPERWLLKLIKYQYLGGAFNGHLYEKNKVYSLKTRDQLFLVGEMMALQKFILVNDLHF